MADEQVQWTCERGERRSGARPSATRGREGAVRQRVSDGGRAGPVDLRERRTPQRRAAKRDARLGVVPPPHIGCLTLGLRHASSTRPIHEEPALTRSEIWRLEKYLR